MATPCVHRNLGSLVGACGFQQNVPEPPRIAALEAKSLAEYPSLVATARVRRIEAVILDLADIEHSLVPLRQIGCHGGCLVSQRSLRCILMQSRREQQRIMGAIEWLPLAKAKRVEWGAGMRFSPLDARESGASSTPGLAIDRRHRLLLDHPLSRMMTSVNV